MTKEEYEIHRSANHPLGAAKLAKYKNKTRAYNKVDKLDNEYGAVAHYVKRVQKEHEQSHWGTGKGNTEGDTK
jgi:hypothetical protein